MRKLVYDCVENGHVVKTTTVYQEAKEWADRDNCEYKTRLEHFELEKEAKETIERREKRLKRIEELIK